MAHATSSQAENADPETSPLLGSDRDLQNTPQLERQDAASTSKLVFRVAASMLAYLTMGLFISTLGVLLPHIETWYELSDAQVSLVLLFGPIGYVLAAQSNKRVHQYLGRRGIAMIGPILHIVFAAASGFHPSFPIYLLCVVMINAGTGMIDGSFCAWASGTEKANLISGLLHGSLSTGGSFGPVLASYLFASGRLHWFQWYFILAALSLLEAIVLVIAFRNDTAESYRQNIDDKLRNTEGNGRSKSIALTKDKTLWLCSIYLLVYVGAETAVSNWVVAFMVRARNASSTVASLCSSGFWIGMTSGRVILAFLTDRMGVRLASAIYLILAMAMQLVFSLVEVNALSITFMVLLGFFFGPLFPSSIILMVSLLPEEAHVAATSIAASAGQAGAALFPFALGLLVQALGIEAFQYSIVALIAITLSVWILFARSR